MIKAVEFVGVVLGMTGALLVARGGTDIGFIVLLASSLMLSYSAVQQKNWNLVVLQSVYVACNVLGVSNYIFGL